MREEEKNYPKICKGIGVKQRSPIKNMEIPKAFLFRSRGSSLIGRAYPDWAKKRVRIPQNSHIETALLTLSLIHI